MDDRSPLLLHEMFETVARRVPDAVALTAGGSNLPYAALDRRADALAHRLRALGAGPEIPVGVRLGRGVDLVVALLAVLKAGAVYLPVEPRFPVARSALMLARSGARVLVTAAQAHDPTAVGESVQHVLFLDDEPAGAAGPPPRLAVGDDTLAYITYTSGSAGEPKAVGATHASAAAYLRFLAEAGHLRPDDIALQLAAPSFDASIRDILGPLVVGGRLVLVTDERISDVGHLLATMAGEDVTCLPACVPSMLRLLTGHGWPTDQPPARVRRVLVSGETLTAATVAQARDCFGPDVVVVNHYGPTECTMTSTFHVVGPDEPDPIPVGRPPDWGRVYVLDVDLAPVAEGEVGELYIGGAGVSRGYLGDPALTAARFLPDPFSVRSDARMYRTGDLGRVRPDGSLEFRGRLDRQLKINGVRVEPGEIEAVLERHPAVAEVAVTASPGPSGSTALTAYVVGVGGQSPEPSALRAWAGAELPDTLVPRLFVPLPVLPRTTTGKVDRNRLPAPVGAPVSGASSAWDRPGTADEAVMLELWRRLLDRPGLGIHDDLFELGGDSLLAMALVYRIRRRFGWAPTLAELFRTPTVAGVTRLLDGADRSDLEDDPSGRVLDRATRGDRLPLSFAQERLWFFENLLPGSPLNTIPAAFRVDGALDRSALSAAVEQVVARHEALRLSFHTDRGLPTCRLDAGVGELRVVQVPPGQDVDQAVTALARQPMDIGRGPLLDVTLFLSDDGACLLIRLHHLVGDARSLELLVGELTAACRARRERRALDPVEPAVVEYPDYVEWQRSWLTAERVEHHLAFWRRELAGAPPLLDLPADRPRPAVQRYHGATLCREVATDLVTSAARLGRVEGASLFMVLASAWAALLSRYSGQEDLVVGVPVAGRTRVELEQAIGLFVNTLPVRVDLTREPSFRTLLGRVRDAVLRALDHQNFPFERLVEALHAERSLAYGPVFQTLVDLQRAATLKLPGARLHPIEVDTGTARFDISLSFVQRDIGLTAVYTYNTDLFDPETVERLADHLDTLLAAAIAEPDRAVTAVRLLNPSERRRLTSGSGRSRTAGRVVDLIAEQARRTPDRIAASHGDEHLTYTALMARADRLAGRLRGRGLAREALVAVSMERGPDLLVALLGIHRAGAAYLPLDPAHPPERLSYLVSHSSADLVLSRLDQLDGVPTSQRRAAPSDAAAQRGELAYVIYTSGSTGEPKGVEVTQTGLTNVLTGLAVELDFTADDVLVAVTTLSFDIAALELFLPLLTGGRVVIAPREVASDPVQLRDLLARSAATVMQATPATWQALLDLSAPPSTLRAVLCGGEALPPRLARDLFRLGHQVYNLYGPTETTIWSTVARLDPDDISAPIGEPIGDTTVLVLDQHLEPVPRGVVGELYIGGAGVARGYRGRPDLTAERFLPDPYDPRSRGRLFRTGDRGRWRADGRLEYLSRVDRQIKLHGFRIEPGEVEHALLAHPSITQAIVTARSDPARLDPALGRRLVAHVVTTGRVDADQIRTFLAGQLPAHLLPSVIVPVDALPLTPNGKVDVGRLPDPDGRRPALSTGYAPAGTEAEQTVSGIWAEVLELDRLGVEDDFFDLGGHSLLAIKAIARINDTFGIAVPLQALFAAPTVRRLALRVEEDVIRQILGAPDPGQEASTDSVHSTTPDAGTTAASPSFASDSVGE